MTVTQILHVSLAVSDLPRSQQFYQEILGLIPVERPFNFPGIWYQLGAQQIHLIQVDQVHPDLVNSEKWGRNRHLALAVSSLAEFRHRLEVHQYPIQMSASGRLALFTQDPDANIIELLELSPETATT